MEQLPTVIVSMNMVSGMKKQVLRPVSYTHLTEDDGQKYCYYFNPVSDGTRGKLYVNMTTPDGYHVDELGRWVP